MAIISVNVPSFIAKQFKPYEIVESYDFIEKIEKLDNYEDRVLNFWAEWVPAWEVLNFIRSQK